MEPKYHFLRRVGPLGIRIFSVGESVVFEMGHQEGELQDWFLSKSFFSVDMSKEFFSVQVWRVNITFELG